MIKRFATMLAAVGGALWLAAAPSTAWAEKRVALVVGNSTYQSVNRLPNPARDAAAMAKMFKDAGFDSVDTLIDVGNLEFKRGIRRFEDTATDADIAVVFYAGHGIEIGGTNYLIPIDARLASDRDAQDEAITLDRLVSSADSAKRLRLVILDACRDNPFAGKMRRDSRAGQRGVQSGLTRVDPSTTDTLIAYAAKAGSTADDGDGEHSPFTTALLKGLTVPGRDIRIAFGYVKDDVMKSTGGRQEPFVYGSLGGGVYSLVPAPSETHTPSASDAKADYELVAKIGSRKAWEVYLTTYKTGFYADLARAQLAALPTDVQLASLSPTTAPASRQPTTKEALDWDRIKDSTDQNALQTFIKRYPDSPLSIKAQDRLTVLINAQKEREEQARLAKEESDRKKAEQAAARQREEDERRAKAAEAAQKAKAEEAARQAAEAKRKAEEAERQAAEAKRKAEDAAARQAAEAQRKAEEAARILAAAEAAKARQESEKAARAAEAEKQKAAAAAALETACKEQGDQLAALQAKGSAGSGIEDMTKFVKTVTCDRIKPQAMAALNTFNAEIAKRDADLVRSAQTELTRIGCYTGTVDGRLNDGTRSALSRYLSAKGLPSGNPAVTDDLVSALQKQQPITCLRTCPTGQSLSGDTCIANARPAAPAQSASRKSNEDSSSRKQQPIRQQATAPARPPAPRATQQAAIPRVSGGGGSYGGGGGHAPMVGVGF